MSDLDINPATGEILLQAEEKDTSLLRQSKIKAYELLAPGDFVLINGTWEAKRDGLIKILSSLPVSYEWSIKERTLVADHAFIHGVLTVSTGSINRVAGGMGVCERKELTQGGLHFMNARAETRALKRSIETIFGSVINYYVIHHLQRKAA